MPRTYEPIASQTLGSDTSSVTFSSIPGTYTDLVLVMVASSTHTGVTDFRVRFNSSSTANYSRTRLTGDGSSATSTRDTDGSYGYFGHLNNSTTNFSVSRTQIMSYANTNVFTTTLVESAEAGTRVQREVGLWRVTDAITSILIIAGAGNLRLGSTFALYGIKAA